MFKRKTQVVTVEERELLLKAAATGGMCMNLRVCAYLYA